MKIFLGIPKSKSSINYEKLKQNVFLVLKPYYGVFMFVEEGCFALG